jgi:hypothetical protein
VHRQSDAVNDRQNDFVILIPNCTRSIAHIDFKSGTKGFCMENRKACSFLVDRL